VAGGRSRKRPQAEEEGGDEGDQGLEDAEPMEEDV
jgi:hypothetical protein